MKREYIPILVEVDGKKELWRMDVTKLNISDLVQLKKIFMCKTQYNKTIQALDSIIHRDIETIIPSNHMNSGSYMRTFKKNKKEEKQRKRTKKRRR